MSVTDKIIYAGSLITAVLIISGFFIATYKALRKEEKWREEKDKHDNENYLSILRLTIVSQEMPLSERIAAGDKYIALNGNGAVKHKYQELLKQLPKEKE